MSTFVARWRRVISGLAWDAVALTVFTIGSMILMHPLIAGGFGNFCIDANESNDPQVFIWGLAWFPYAIIHGLDPLFTRLVFAPAGYNLAWSTTIPAPAMMMWPITRHFGPLISYNLLCVLAPILSGYTAFVLCRHISRAPLASIAGGLVYGFSTYQRIEAHHLNLALSFIPPVLVLLFAMRMEDRIGGWRYRLLLAGSLILQFLTAPEIFASAIFFGAVAISLSAWIGNSHWRMRMRMPVRESITGIAVAVVVLSPYLYRFIPSPFGLTPIYNPAHCSSDLLGLLLPTAANVAGHLHVMRVLARRIAFGCEPSAFMGLLPVVSIWIAFRPMPAVAEAFPTERFLLLLLIAIVVLSLGPVLHVDGFPVAPSVWLPALIFPIVNNALPARFVLYAFLVLGVMMALWLSDVRRHAAMRWLISAAAIVSVLPSVVPAANTALPFFKQQMYRKYLSPGETVMLLPFGFNGEAMKWQAQSDFYFRVAGGYLGVTPPEYEGWPIVEALLAESPYIPDFGDQFKALIIAHRVGAVIVPEIGFDQYAKLCATLGVVPVRTGGVLIYRLSPANFASWNHATAAEMDTRYNLERFEMLIGAARGYLASGYPYAELSPFTAAQLGLIDTSIVGEPPISQTAAFPFIRAARGSDAFQALVRFMVSHQMIRERLAVELGPAPAEDATSTGIWLGPWSDGSIAIGVSAGPQAAASLCARFGASAGSIYYPYPLPYSSQPGVSDRPHIYPQMLIMTFKPAVLRLESTAQAHRGPPHRIICRSDIYRY